MNKAKAIYALLGGLLILSCAVTGRSPRSARQQPSYPPSLQAPYLYSEGIKAKLLGGDTTRTAAIFNAVLRLDSTHAPSLYELAQLYAASAPGKAIGYTRRACLLDTANVWYRGQLARLLVFHREYDPALDVYRQLMRMAPHDPENYRMTAALYEQRGQPFTAIAVLDTAEYKLGRYEELSDFKRQLLIDVGLYDKAIAESRIMIADRPWEARNYGILGAIYERQGKDSLALANYRQAMALDSTDIEVLSSLNAFYRNRGDLPGFFATARQMILSDKMDAGDKISMIDELRNNRSFYEENYPRIGALISELYLKYPKNFDVIELYGSHIIAVSGAEQGAAFFKAHLKDPGATIEMYNTVMEVEAYLKRPDSLAKYSTLALEKFPANTDLYTRHGNALAYMERYDEAIKYYELALRHASTDSLRSVVHGMMGDVEHQRGDKKQCYKYYEQALREWPDNALVLNNLSYYFSTDGPSGRDIPRAVEMAARAVELSPGNSTYLDTYGWALYKAGRLAEAKKVMRQAISLDTTQSSELFIHYGDILYQLKEYFMASVYWKKALENGYDADAIAERMKKIEGK